MKEKELRLATVFYGGVSLAIYQHGINKELLNLVRASKAYHTPASALGRQAPAHTLASVMGDTDPELGTAEVYFDLLKRIGERLDLRVILDVISGSSAGAINGIALARAIAHDLSLEPLTELWLAEADMMRILAPEAKARLWSKWYLWPFVTPLIAGLRREGLLPAALDRETRRAFSTFVRSRWFRPPLDGRRLSLLLLDGLAAMGEPKAPNRSLLPHGQGLDLLVTATDYHGVERAIPAHDPPIVRELEHRHILRFSRRALAEDLAHSDFGVENLPSLAFAGRASASYPGAFPPAQLREIDDLLAARGTAWTTRAQFLRENFSQYRDQGRSPEEAVLVDGSILNNKPIGAALDAIRTHGAFREVDRRLVYIDPHPHEGLGGAVPRAPGFFATLLGASSSLPRNQPIHDEIAEIGHANEQLRRLKNTMAAIRPKVRRLVEEATDGGISQAFDQDRLTRWRLDSANLLGRTELVQAAWFRAMLLDAAAFVVRLINALCGYPEGSARALAVGRVMEAWSLQSGLYAESYHIPLSIVRDADLPPFARFIVNFGVEYKRRRVTLVIQTVNDLYSHLGEPGSDDTPPAGLDALKAALYRALSRLGVYDSADFLGPAAAARARALFGDGAIDGIDSPVLTDAQLCAITALVDLLGESCGLAAINEISDEALSSAAFFALGPQCRQAVLTSYLGFVYWDSVLFATTSALGVGPGGIAEVLVDRISPADARTLAPDGPAPVLQGGALAGFAGFLSRAIRENDYLWGRLHAVERLLTIVADSAATGQGGAPIDIAPFRTRAFAAVIAIEKGRLRHVADLISRIEAAISRL